MTVEELEFAKTKGIPNTVYSIAFDIAKLKKLGLYSPVMKTITEKTGEEIKSDKKRFKKFIRQVIRTEKKLCREMSINPYPYTYTEIFDYFLTQSAVLTKEDEEQMSKNVNDTNSVAVGAGVGIVKTLIEKQKMNRNEAIELVSNVLYITKTSLRNSLR